jgi:hypothetical protein
MQGQVWSLAPSLLAGPGPLLACQLYRKGVIYRDPADPVSGRWAVSQEELPSSRAVHYTGSKADYFPPYCTGCFYILTPHTVTPHASTALHCPVLARHCSAVQCSAVHT